MRFLIPLNLKHFVGPNWVNRLDCWGPNSSVGTKIGKNFAKKIDLKLNNWKCIWQNFTLWILKILCIFGACDGNRSWSGKIWKLGKLNIYWRNQIFHELEWHTFWTEWFDECYAKWDALLYTSVTKSRVRFELHNCMWEKKLEQKL